MKRINVLTIITIILSCILLSGCEEKEKLFYLEDKYYGNAYNNSSTSSDSYIELSSDQLNNLIKNKESFAIFIYQPLCYTSYEFNKVLTQFSNTYQVILYKMSFSDMKETILGKDIKYYPSLVIFNNGKMIDYLDANSEEDSIYYKSVDGVKEWFSKYVIFKEINGSNNNIPIEPEVDSNLKIDAIIENVTYNENKVNVYFFWGNGCPHCEEEFKFFKSIENEYGDYFTLNTFEVWYNQQNAYLLNQFANKMGDVVSGVPYTIIGNKTFKGYGSSYEKEILDAIKTQYKNSYDVYFDGMVN